MFNAQPFLRSGFEAKLRDNLRLTIVVSPEGFSFAIFDGEENLPYAFKSYPFDNNIGDWNLIGKFIELRKALEPLLNLTFQQIRVIPFISNVLFLPPSTPSDQITKCFQSSLAWEKDSLIREGGESIGYSCHFSMHSGLCHTLYQLFPDLQFQHPLFLLARKSMATLTSDHLFAFQTHSQLWMTFSKRGRLEIAHAFPAQSLEESLYFILLIAKQTDTSPSALDIRYSGVAEWTGEVFSKLSNYLPGARSLSGTLLPSSFPEQSGNLPETILFHGIQVQCESFPAHTREE